MDYTKLLLIQLEARNAYLENKITSQDYLKLIRNLKADLNIVDQINIKKNFNESMLRTVNKTT